MAAARCAGRCAAALALLALARAAPSCEGELRSAVCSESEVELAEEQLLETLSFQLLQRNVQHMKAMDAAPPPVYEQEGLTSDAASPDAASDEAVDVTTEDVEPVVNCTEYPVFCDPKVDCAKNPITSDDRAAWDQQLATADGHANLRTWCMVYPMYAVSLSKCIIEDNKPEYAKLMYEDQTKNGLTDADAVYCYVAGHCNNTEATEKTTVQEAEAMCNARYGDRWKHTGWADFMGVVSRAQSTMTESTHKLATGAMSWSEMLKIARNETEISAMTSCAMGNYQCDVFYCKANYCNNPQYQQRFGNMSWATA